MKLPPICQQCTDKAHCSSLCNGIDILANGNVKCSEILLSDPYDDHHSNTDYNQILAEIQSGKPITIEEIRTIEDMRVRMIATALHAQIPVKDIAELLNLSKRHIYRLIHVTTIVSLETP